jgi:hypothetical protein
MMTSHRFRLAWTSDLHEMRVASLPVALCTYVELYLLILGALKEMRL